MIFTKCQIWIGILKILCFLIKISSKRNRDPPRKRGRFRTHTDVAFLMHCSHCSVHFPRRTSSNSQNCGIGERFSQRILHWPRNLQQCSSVLEWRFHPQTTTTYACNGDATDWGDKRSDGHRCCELWDSKNFVLSAAMWCTTGILVWICLIISWGGDSCRRDVVG